MQIPYQKFTLTLEAIEELHLPYYKGSTFRGGFGNIFRRIACVLRLQDCLDCMLKSRCIYAYVFETSSNEGADIMNMHKYERVPHPFVIEPPEIDSRVKVQNSKIILPGSTIDFNLILIGKAAEYLPYFIYTFDELGKNGIGKGRGKYRLVSVVGWSNHRFDKFPVYNDSDKTIRKTEVNLINIPDEFKPTESINKITLQFITPLRIKHNRDLVVNPEFHILMRNLLRRLGLLYYFHCGNNKPPWDHRAIIKHAESIRIANSTLTWLDWERYSTRQGIRMKLGGLVGEITYSGNIEPFLPYLEAGESLHIGKGTSFGLGKYNLMA